MGKSNFEKTLLELGYEFDSQEGSKITFRKRTQYADLVLIFNLELKYINPILVPSCLILHEKDFEILKLLFKDLRNAAAILAQKTQNTYKVLN